ncbi:hypothetical protein [Actinomadura rayongensis]|uniref:Uncharacterized protein n=1 Tax=Actinomadura rayongensis TaxID=1429076 RepID=A0A6I4W8L2_9ACTN|nr:hypothetical protein [Actinomadura rayongensis]MXQ66477.1 hypothetical protein [Actinomadura rayongensis]
MRVGWPFFNEFRSVDDVLRFMWHDKKPLDRRRKLAIACALVGDRDGAVASLAALWSMAQSRHPAMRERSRAFIEHFAAHFGALSSASIPGDR